MNSASSPVRTLGEDGFAIFRGVLSGERVEALRREIAAVVHDEPVKPFGVRSIAKRCEGVADLAIEPGIRQIVANAIPSRFLLVRSIFFDKIPGANWHVGWHQDLSIAVKEKPPGEWPGFTGWTVKEGVSHVQAPPEVLDRMVTLRIHLDNAGEENGPLRVIPGSHAAGRLNSGAIQEWIDRDQAVTCEVEAGDILAMRPQILHASHIARAENVTHRRVIHLEYAPADLLPPGLRWAEEEC